MSQHNLSRYTSVAIALHWLIAIFIIAMLAFGKWMTSLPENDPTRFAATQWHKSFGIVVLVLSVVRLLWRFCHVSVALPSAMKRWEKFASGAAHFLLYGLMFALPLSGWLMVSASPLNLPTVLFGVIPLPHLPLWVADKAVIADASHQAHHFLGGLLILMVILHVLAALRHQFILRDNLFARMAIGPEHQVAADNKHGLVYGAVVLFAGLLLLGSFDRPVNNTTTSTSAMESSTQTPAGVATQVKFFAQQSGQPLIGYFQTVDIQLQRQPYLQLVASVQTDSVRTDDMQIEMTLPTADWFNSKNFAQAAFVSDHIEALSAQQYNVTGTLTIKGVGLPLEFPLTVSSDGAANGEFVIDRNRYGVGDRGGLVADEVAIEFVFLWPEQ